MEQDMEPCEKFMSPQFLELARRAGFTGPAMENTQFGTNQMTAISNLIELVAEECAKTAGALRHVYDYQANGTADEIRRKFNLEV